MSTIATSGSILPEVNDFHSSESLQEIADHSQP